MAEKKRRKFLNMFDIALLLLVAAVVFVLFKVGVFGTTAPAASRDVKSVTYVIQMSPMRYGTEEKIKAGDTLIESVRKTSVGVVSDVEIKDAVYYVLNAEEGNYGMATAEGEKAAYVTVTVDCVVTDSDITTVDGRQIICGDSLNVYGPGYFGFGTVVSRERGEGI